MDIHVDITGDRKVGVRFDTFPDALYDALKEEISALSEELYARVVAATPEKTGRLRSEERLRLFTDPNRISGYIDVGGVSGSQDFAKAGALEYGAHRATNVSAHSMSLDHAWGRKFAAPETVLVSAYTRTPNIETFAFERGPLADMAPEVVERLNAVIEKTVADANE